MPHKSVCFTGHRPNKLLDPYDENHTIITDIKTQLEQNINNAIIAGYTDFYNGMAMGTDLLAAEIIIKLKRKHLDLKLIAVIPYKEQAKNFTDYWWIRYQHIIAQADKIIYISDEYTTSCLRERNCYLVDNSNLVIAVFNGSKSGTLQTLNYAQKCQKKIIIINVAK